jgi:hypothetical protein
MPSDAQEWVCLECYNRWKPRSEPDSKAQCSNASCRSRFTFPFPLVEKHVSEVQSLIDEQPPPVGKIGTLPKPLETLPALVNSGREMFEHTDRSRAMKGLKLIDSIREILTEWRGRNREPLVQAIDRLHERN